MSCVLLLHTQSKWIRTQVDLSRVALQRLCPVGLWGFWVAYGVGEPGFDGVRFSPLVSSSERVLDKFQVFS